MVGLYIHIPFCRIRCPYCDFLSSATAGHVPDEFVDALCDEIESFTPVDPLAEVNTVFLGGGTPSLLKPLHISRIIACIERCFRVSTPEITIEANPDDVHVELADRWSEIGISRVSLGVQSFDDEVLRYLGRRHDAHAAHRACEVIGDRFDNWGIDLIMGAHPVGKWDATMSECVAFSPPHVSAYSLTYEQGTPFGDRKGEALEDDQVLELYHRTHDHLSQYSHYEISNFARPGHECIHNLVYWQNHEYMGFGPGAYSFMDGVRSRNVLSIADYCQGACEKAERIVLGPDEIMVETLIQHFRLLQGLGKEYFRLRFGEEVEDRFGRAIEGLKARGLLLETDSSIRPTSRGFDLNNEIGLALVE